MNKNEPDWAALTDAEIFYQVECFWDHEGRAPAALEKEWNKRLAASWDGEASSAAIQRAERMMGA